MTNGAKAPSKRRPLCSSLRTAPDSELKTIHFANLVNGAGVPEAGLMILSRTGRLEHS